MFELLIVLIVVILIISTYPGSVRLSSNTATLRRRAFAAAPLQP